MRSEELAEKLREVQADGEQRLTEQGLTLEDIAPITRRVLKGREYASLHRPPVA
jgi:hypothetical protein